MGGAPPIPVDPVHSLPEAVFRQTRSPQTRLQTPQQEPQRPQQSQQNQEHQQPPPQSQHRFQTPPMPQQSQQMSQQMSRPTQTTSPRPFQHTGGQQYPPQSSTRPLAQPLQPGRADMQQSAPPQYQGPQGSAAQSQMMQSQYPAQRPGQMSQQMPSMMMGPQGMSWMVPPPNPPRYNQTSRSVPHGHTPPPDRELDRAIADSQTPRHQSQALMGDTPRRHSQRHPAPGSVQPPRLEPVSRPSAADSYLDRVEHDPQLKQMLSGAPSRTIHTGGGPGSEAFERGRSVSDSRVPRSPSLMDKPLPDPFDTGLSRSQTTRGQSRPTTDNRGSRRRQSLTDGLHAHSHALNQIADGDRYPAFPGVGGHGRGHSRQSSYGSVDPAGLALPP